MKEVIKIKRLEYTYPDGTSALKGIDMNVFEGECIGLVGPNGAGKSTLLLHLNGILRGTGEMKIMGSEIKDANLDFIRSKVGLVFQDPEDQLFMPTVFDDVAFGPINMELDSTHVRKRVDTALGFVDMKDYKERISHHLSFGEKKKVSIATVLSMNPEILVLDEPSSNLDPHSRRHLMKLIKSFSSTKIIAAHDLELILQLCNKVFILDEGKIISSGPPEKLLSNEELMESHGLEVPASLKNKY